MGGNGTALAKLDKAKQMLAEVRTVDDAKKIVNLAEAARVYARQVELGLEAQNHAAEIKLRAQRRGGEILTKMDSAQGKRTDLPSTSIEPLKKLKTEQYKEIGITTFDASRWQQIAQLPEEKFEAVISEALEHSSELTTSAILREAQAYKREINHSNLDDLEMPIGKYRVFYADPPWKYNDSGVVTDSDAYGRAERHYPTMSIDELCLLPIKEMAEDDAVLFLWATSPLLEDSFQVIKAWGFEYKTSFVWDKIKHNFGHYNSVRHEFLLVCTRGSCTPDHLELFDSVQSIERSEKHSEKPQEFVGIIETLYTHGGKIELFARSQHEGWEAWGNESAT